MTRSVARPTSPPAVWTAISVTFFAAVSVVLPIVQRGHYDVPGQTMSELALGRFGWLQNVAFCVLGGGTAVLAIALRRQLDARIAPVLLSVAAALDVVSAFFHAVRVGDSQTPESVVHMSAGVGTFLLTYAAMFTLVRPLRRTPALADFATPTRWWALAAVVAFVACAPPVVGQSHFGIGQRVMAAVFLSWMITLSLRLQFAPSDEQRRVSQASPARRYSSSV